MEIMDQNIADSKLSTSLKWANSRTVGLTSEEEETVLF